MISPRIESSARTGTEALASQKGTSSTNISLLLAPSAGEVPCDFSASCFEGQGWVVQTAVHSPSPEHRCWQRLGTARSELLAYAMSVDGEAGLPHQTPWKHWRRAAGRADSRAGLPIGMWTQLPLC